MLMLECPECRSCFSIIEWNTSPHRGGDSLPEDIETDEEFQQWLTERNGTIYDCPECGQSVVSDDMTAV